MVCYPWPESLNGELPSGPLTARAGAVARSQLQIALPFPSQEPQDLHVRPGRQDTPGPARETEWGAV